jgi:2-isopropylmalate synthase
MTPASVGVPQSSIVLGKHSGRHALEARLRSMGYALTRDELESVYTAFLKLADKQKTIEEKDLVSLLPPAATMAASS